MSTGGKLYGPRENFRTQRILVAAEYSGVKVNVDDKFELGVTNAEEQFLKKFPFGQVPALEEADGKTLCETSAISQYVGHKVAGSDNYSRAQIEQWVSLADNEFLPAVLGWVLPSVSAMQFNKQAVDTSKQQLMKLLETLNDYLLTRTYLVGERVSLADITLSCNLLLAFQHVLDENARSSLINVTRWFNTCIHQPHFKVVLGDVKLCDKADEFDANKFKSLQSSSAAGHGKQEGRVHRRSHRGSHRKSHCSEGGEEHHDDGGHQKGKKGKKDKKAGGDKPASAPKKDNKKEPEPEEEMDEAEKALAAEPKKKDPFEQFPKGTLNVDEFKRVYSNEDIMTKALPYLWEHFDKENFSFWYCEYKYPQELTLTFMSCNLITGMMQRLDKMRKNAFGSMILFGENYKSSISGVWFWRSHELAFTLSDDWQIDYESYEWKKLDFDDPAARKLITEYFSEQGDFDGKKIVECKIFK